MSKCNEYHLIQMGGPQSKRFAAASVCNEREHIILRIYSYSSPCRSIQLENGTCKAF